MSEPHDPHEEVLEAATRREIARKYEEKEGARRTGEALAGWTRALIGPFEGAGERIERGIGGRFGRIVGQMVAGTGGGAAMLALVAAVWWVGRSAVEHLDDLTGAILDGAGIGVAVGAVIGFGSGLFTKRADESRRDQ